MKAIFLAAVFIGTFCSFANAAQKVTCGDLVFTVPSRLGDLPPVDFEYPTKMKIFSFRDGSLLVIAMDAEDESRTRIVVSAQLNKAKGTYDGQIVVDDGGHQIQLGNAPISCTVK